MRTRVDLVGASFLQSLASTHLLGVDREIHLVSVLGANLRRCWVKLLDLRFRSAQPEVVW